MTTLTITPKISDKTARFKGAVAAGEHVAVTIKGGAEWLGEDDGANLTLRVLDLVTGRTLAVFPRPEETYGEDEAYVPDEWGESAEDPNDLYCELNLNTTRMVAAARHMLRVPVLFVLGDTDDPRTLYFRDRYEVEYWPERIGDTTPYDLDNWPKQIDEWTELVEGFDATLTGHVADTVKHITAAERTAWNGKADASALSAYVNAASYDSTAKKILLKHGSNTVAEINAADFVKDGMISSVSVSSGSLVITFNTDAGKSPISIPLSDFGISQIQSTLAGKRDKTDLAYVADSWLLVGTDGTRATLAPDGVNEWAYSSFTLMYDPQDERWLLDTGLTYQQCAGSSDATRLSFAIGQTTYLLRKGDSLALASESAPMESVTWAVLKAIRDAGMLVAGKRYRITDYVATVANVSGAQSANHPFDVIVTAVSPSALDEHARAIAHVGDLYFSGNDLAAWDVWYCLDNDVSRFGWADQTNGKGVVYRLVDEWLNDCPYDFKGICFSRETDGTAVWRYTFDGGAAGAGSDYSLDPSQEVYHNTVGRMRTVFSFSSGDVWKQVLNNIVFLGVKCYRNTIGRDCGQITVGDRFYDSEIGGGSGNIVLGSKCFRCRFGRHCTIIRFGDNCNDNAIADKSDSITFGSTCRQNIVGRSCHDIEIGDNSDYIRIGDNCDDIRFGDSASVKKKYAHITIADETQYLYLDRVDDATGAYRNVTVERGLGGSGLLSRKTISDSAYNQTWQTVYRPAGERVVTV